VFHLLHDLAEHGVEVQAGGERAGDRVEDAQTLQLLCVKGFEMGLLGHGGGLDTSA
jgi:hypothetical protein